ncbi:putative structural protein [Pseudomonas phage MR6]|uniref:Putative structural protein n=1 Tax=Pseudomonas phage MR5 TaxID=2711172 RepID=A0A6M3TCU3_9CAUD|nr:putative structural protein [Pseudomonas phage MR5]QJD54864.1 putative structural protein [Pseudomonas phage MR6]QJD54924.1 putative structural protein [Pseudomonas phage MR7]QJD54984.1 putative structural protein [Pseudomonas phage MR8]QJD55041.1 putative structural protein [Pseudomonas phage MR12]QJD55344.1 putative structural protein [Pseudomonas phage MR18]QJF74608.1 putative structural protein [Pseudomonas phage MR16]
MGKKIKKVLNPVAKVFTLGATDLNGEGWGTGIVDSVAGTDYNGLKAAAKKAQDTADKQQRDLIDSMNASAAANANANVDLALENVPDTQIGGTATAQASSTSKRKRQGAGGVAASLGINA